MVMSTDKCGAPARRSASHLQCGGAKDCELSEILCGYLNMDSQARAHLPPVLVLAVFTETDL